MLKSWKIHIRSFTHYLKLERSMSEHSIDAYIRDVQKLASLEEIIEQKVSPEQVRQEHIEIFIGRIYELGLGEKNASTNNFWSEVLL